MTPAFELPTIQVASAPAETDRPPAPTITRERYESLARRVKLLSWLSLAWMTVEGAVAIAAGIVASSIALVGFGLDSAIEGFASVIIIWRASAVTACSRTPPSSERRSSWPSSSSCSPRTWASSPSRA